MHGRNTAEISTVENMVNQMKNTNYKYDVKVYNLFRGAKHNIFNHIIVSLV